MSPNNYVKPEKVYHLGFNKGNGQVTIYSTKEDAERSGNWNKTVSAIDFKLAKIKFLEIYRDENT
jgi:hypothetical protein